MVIHINRIKCKRCGEVITSEYSHDLKWCRCGDVAVDGGMDYLKRLANNPAVEFVELSEYETDTLSDN